MIVVAKHKYKNSYLFQVWNQGSHCQELQTNPSPYKSLQGKCEQCDIHVIYVEHMETSYDEMATNPFCRIKSHTTSLGT